jgi:hypothetical protein
MFRKNLHYLDGKKVESFGLFIAPIVITLMSFPLIHKYPVPFAIVLVSLGITIILSSLSFLLTSFKANSYLKKYHFQLWKKYRSRSFRERREAQKEINSMVLQIPQLEKPFKYSNNIAYILFVIWTLIFLGIYSLIICSAIWDWPFCSLL